MAGEPWDAREVDLTVDVYFSMLKLELDGAAYSKAAFRRDLRTRIARSNGSLEYKFQNISAVLAEAGAAFVDGYKPAANVQGLLRERVLLKLAEERALRDQMARTADAPPPLTAIDLGEPVAIPIVPSAPGGSDRARSARIVDFQEREARNRALGLAGELAVVRLERRRLTQLGRRDLAQDVRHVSVLDGDGLGFDVLSFDGTGARRLIEVKTTRHAKELPFLVTRNEVGLSDESPNEFWLYRLFRFGKDGSGHFEMPGSLRRTATLVPTEFEARVRQGSGSTTDGRVRGVWDGPR